MKSAFAIAFVLFLPLAVRAITIDTVPVGNAGNDPDFPGNGIFGTVGADYRIGTTEVTNAQYVEFLNAVAASDPNGLYNSSFGFVTRYGIARSGSSGSYTYSVKPDVPNGGPDGTNYTYGDKPVVFVSWNDAARFVNWLNNRATAGASTETGTYTMANGSGVTRNTGSIWFLPNENEWYKAAYYSGSGIHGSYYAYPTKSDTAPDNNVPADDSGNSANYYVTDFTQNISYPTTSVGAYTLSPSAYGTFDQGGNVWEWTETQGSGTTRVRRGGSFDSDGTGHLDLTISSAYRETMNLSGENDNMGFRVASIPLLAGDYNANGVVDAADYAVWRKFLNQTALLPGDVTPGTVTQSDYTVWRAHFGQTYSSGAGAGSLLQDTVPEPAVMPLLGTIFLVLFALRTRRDCGIAGYSSAA